MGREEREKEERWVVVVTEIARGSVEKKRRMAGEEEGSSEVTEGGKGSSASYFCEVADSRGYGITGDMREEIE